MKSCPCRSGISPRNRQSRDCARGGSPRAGLTIIEVLVVVAILGVLMAMIVPAVQASREAARNLECRNKLRQLGLISLAYHDTYGIYPRNTIRPRGITALNGQPPGNLWDWDSGSFESWCRQIMPSLDNPQAKAQDAILAMGCPSDPRGPNYKIPTYGFTWYVGVYSNRHTEGNGVITDDTESPVKISVRASTVSDGTSQTIMFAERAPPADGQWGWWDTKCCLEDTLSSIVGDRYIYGAGIFGACPDPDYYQPASTRDVCTFNTLSAFHPAGGNFCMADGSVRAISFQTAKTPCGTGLLLEALASRNGHEICPID